MSCSQSSHSQLFYNWWNFCLLDLNNNSLKYRTALSLQPSEPTPLATLVSFSTNTLPSRTKSLHFLKSCYCHICELRYIRPCLDFKTASTTATSIVHSKLDYCNSVSIITFQTVKLTGSNRFKIKTLLLDAVVKAPKSTHITAILKSFHWLKVNERIE